MVYEFNNDRWIWYNITMNVLRRDDNNEWGKYGIVCSRNE
jgi:hypothetical protein